MNALLLPGTLCDAALWTGVTLPRDARVLDSVRGSSLKEAAEHAVQDAPRRFHLIGFSLGAILAFEVLRRFPARVARLTLISANPHAPTPAQLELWAAQRRQVEAGQFDNVVETIAASAGGHQARITDMARHVGTEVFLQQLELLRSRPDSRPTLAAWQGPATFLVGENDVTTPPDLAEEMRALVKGASLRIIPGAGHYLPLDAPPAVSDVLNEVAHA